MKKAKTIILKIRNKEKMSEIVNKKKKEKEKKQKQKQKTEKMNKQMRKMKK